MSRIMQRQFNQFIPTRHLIMARSRVETTRHLCDHDDRESRH